MTIKQMKTRRTPEEIRFWQEIRSSNAASPHKNKAKYSRKPKYPKDMYV
jgi:hypothetical protein